MDRRAWRLDWPTKRAARLHHTRSRPRTTRLPRPGPHPCPSHEGCDMSPMVRAWRLGGLPPHLGVLAASGRPLGGSTETRAVLARAVLGPYLRSLDALRTEVPNARRALRPRRHVVPVARPLRHEEGRALGVDDVRGVRRARAP